MISGSFICFIIFKTVFVNFLLIIEVFRCNLIDKIILFGDRFVFPEIGCGCVLYGGATNFSRFFLILGKGPSSADYASGTSWKDGSLGVSVFSFSFLVWIASVRG